MPVLFVGAGESAVKKGLNFFSLAEEERWFLPLPPPLLPLRPLRAPPCLTTRMIQVVGVGGGGCRLGKKESGRRLRRQKKRGKGGPSPSSSSTYGRT